METWQTLLIIIVGLILVYLWYRKKHPKVVPAAQSTGVQLRKAAEAIPVYGTAVKAAGVVGKPLNKALDKFTQVQIDALKHVPVVGNVLAKPAEISKKYVDQLNGWLGL